LSDFDGTNFSFKRLAGEIPRNELEKLFRRTDLSVEGSLKVSDLSSRSVEGSTDVDSDTGSDGDAVGEMSIVSGNADGTLGAWKSPGPVACCVE
jgi:hypothetical protein